MPLALNHLAKVPIAAALVLGALSLSACATRGYVDEQIATLSTRVDAVDAKAQDAIQRADAAASAAQAAATAAQAAAADAQSANQRLDQLTPRVDTLEQSQVRRRPRN